jgi:hypothetical protein
MTTQEILAHCTIEGMVVKMPNIQLDRKAFADVKKALSNVGGTWKGGKIAGFVFEEDPTQLMKEISSGKKRNIKQETQFFATSPELSDKLVEYAGIEFHHDILEPSAGDGAIVKAVNRIFEKKGVDCVEMMPLNREKLEKLNTTKLVGDDFLKFEGEYDRIIANPPFSKNQDITHVRHMYDQLKSGGRLVSITSVSWTKGSQKKQKEFREWLTNHGAVVFLNEAGSFKSSGTNVETATIILNRS